MPRRTLVPLIVAAALFMDILDSTIIATSLPQIASSFGEDPVRLSLAITAYLLGLAVFLPVSGYVADRFGARRVFALAIVVFTLSSALCGLSQNLSQLFLARIMQGIGGSMMTPVGRLLILRTFEKREFVAAMTYFTIPALIAPIIGPPLGGFITTYAHWRWIFFINLPIGLIGITLVLLFIPNVREESPPRLDVKGWLLVAVALACLLFGFENLGRSTLPLPLLLTMIATGLFAVLLFIRHARLVPSPVLDLALLKIRTFHVAVIGGLVFRLGLGASQLLLPLMLQIGFGLTAFAAGLITLFGAAGAMTTRLLAPPLFRRFGFRKILLGNTAACTVFFIAFFCVSSGTPHMLLALLFFLNGGSRSLQFTALNTISYADVEPRRMSASSTLAAVMQQFSIATGVACGALLLHLLAAGRGGQAQHLLLDDFRYAFIGLALVTLASGLYFIGLSDKAGSSVSGYGLDEARDGSGAMASEGNATQPSGPRASSG